MRSSALLRRRSTLAVGFATLLAVVAPVFVAPIHAQASKSHGGCAASVGYTVLFANSVFANGALFNGDYVCSNDGEASSKFDNQAFSLDMQCDGNLVLNVGGGDPIWASRTGGHACNSGYFANMQCDGNLVVYNPSSVPQWASNTGGHTCNYGYYLDVQSDGNLVVYNPSNVALYSSNTATAGPDTIAFNGGDCWRSGTVSTCFSNWGGKSATTAFRAIDQTGGVYGSYPSSWISTAVSNWDNAAGTLRYNYCDTNKSNCTYTPLANDIYVYIKTLPTNSSVYGFTMPAAADGVTFACNTSGTPNACNSGWGHPIQWAEIYINSSNLTYGSSLVIDTVMHRVWTCLRPSP